MIRDILCDSDCIYQEKGLCEKQNDITMSFLNGLSIMVECSDYIARKVSKCCGKAVVIRGSDEGTNYYECVACSQPCDTKTDECLIENESSRTCEYGIKNCVSAHNIGGKE